MRKRLLYIILISITLPLVVLVGQQLQKFISRALTKPANIVIDTKNVAGVLINTWSAFAQGGEEPPPMLSSVVTKLQELSPRYIRIDHIYDFYNVVQRGEEGFSYDFTRLDKTVDDIIASGALPFISLSYMPSIFTISGSIIDAPTDWLNWKDLVRTTIEHYSGRNNRNLTNVYYEVWNEPELPQFGRWKLSGEKDYRLLYFYAATGANEAFDVNKFYLGGPSVGSYYSNWVNDFLSYITQNNLRLDFYSWHRYSKNPDIFASDAKNIRQNLSSFPTYASIPLILTEWGIESENNLLNNSVQAAAFSVVSATKFHRDIKLAFAFEIKDGPPPNGGKWGLLTHEKDTQPLYPKPRFKAFEILSKMTGDQLHLDGEGTFVSGLAAYFSQSITVILGNYDLAGQNTENVPVTFTGLDPSSYSLKYNYPLEQISGNYEIVTTDGTITKTFLMAPNTILYLELTSLAPLATFIPGPSGKLDDQALVLKNSNTPLIFNSPEFRLLPRGTISFDLKPFWENNDNKSFNIFEAPYSTASGIINKLFLSKQKTPEGNTLVFGIAKDKEEVKVSSPIADWQRGIWHHLDIGWDQAGLFISVDGKPTITIAATIDVYNGEILNFYPIEAAIDNLKIVLGDQQLISRLFNGSVDR